jgi:hypothetical protein
MVVVRRGKWVVSRGSAQVREDFEVVGHVDPALEVPG